MRSAMPSVIGNFRVAVLFVFFIVTQAIALRKIMVRLHAPSTAFMKPGALESYQTLLLYLIC